MTNPTFQHRHYKEIAKTIADMHLGENIKREVAISLADAFARDRFMAAARGEPSNGRDKR